MRYIAMLRGINVSGQKKIKMTELKKLFEEMGFENVVTYIQSGNVVFNYKKTRETHLKELIENEIQSEFGFDVSVIIRTPSELEKIISESPFSKISDSENQIYFIFMQNEPEEDRIKKLLEINCDPEKIEISGKQIYLYCPNGYGKAKLNNNLFEQKLKVTATTRNFKTVRELVRLGNDKI